MYLKVYGGCGLQEGFTTALCADGKNKVTGIFFSGNFLSDKKEMFVVVKNAIKYMNTLSGKSYLK